MFEETTEKVITLNAEKAEDNSKMDFRKQICKSEGRTKLLHDHVQCKC
jgi:hypothetical protein